MSMRIDANEAYRRRDFLRLLSTGAVVLATEDMLAGCGGGSGSGTSGSASKQSVLLFPNPADPYVAIVRSSDGLNTSYLGSKSQAGIPTGITSAYVDAQDKMAIHQSQIAFDSSNRPESVLVADGSAMIFDYISSAKVTLTIITTDGTTFVPLQFNPQMQTITRATKRGTFLRSLVMAKDVPMPSTGASALGMVQVSVMGQATSEAEVMGYYKPDLLPDGFPLNYVMGLNFNSISVGTYQYTLPAIPFKFDQTLAQQFVNALQQLVVPICDAITNAPTDPKLPGLGLNAQVISLITAQATMYFGPEGGAIAGIALGAVLLACTATKVLGSGVTKKIVDLLSATKNTGTVSVTAIYPGQSPMTPPSQRANPPSGTLPTFTIDFPAFSVDHIDITPANPTVNWGATIQLAASPRGANGAVVSVPLSNLKWSSSNTSVATVAGGSVSGLMQGSATITVTETKSGKSASVVVTVLSGLDGHWQGSIPNYFGTSGTANIEIYITTSAGNSIAINITIGAYGLPPSVGPGSVIDSFAGTYVESANGTSLSATGAPITWPSANGGPPIYFPGNPNDVINGLVKGNHLTGNVTVLSSNNNFVVQQIDANRVS